MDGQTVVHLHGGILLILEKEGDSDAGCSVGGLEDVMLRDIKQT